MNLLTMMFTIVRHWAYESKTREAFLRSQARRFRRFARAVQRRSPYYARVMEERGIDPSRCTPEQFPILTRHDLMKHFDEIVTDRSITKAGLARFFRESKDPSTLYGRRFYAIHSSGTSGEPAFFVYSRRDWSRGMAHNRRIGNIRLKRQRLAFYGKTGGHYAGVTFAHTATKSIFKHLFRVETFDVNDPMESVVRGMNSFCPDILMGYPSSIRKLAREQLAGGLRIRPRTVQSSGEMLSPSDKALMKQAFGAHVINIYSCSDHAVMGLALPRYGGMYLMEDDLIIQPEADRLLVTNLMNRTLPLIRYEMNDVVIPFPADSAGPLPYLKVRELIGRTEHSLPLINEKGAQDTIGLHDFGELMIPRVTGIQVRAITRESFTVYCVMEDGLGTDARGGVRADITRELQDLLTRKKMRNVRFEIAFVPELIINRSTGKHHLLLDQAPE